MIDCWCLIEMSYKKYIGKQALLSDQAGYQAFPKQAAGQVLVDLSYVTTQGHWVLYWIVPLGA